MNKEAFTAYHACLGFALAYEEYQTAREIAYAIISDISIDTPKEKIKSDRPERKRTRKSVETAAI